MAFLDMASSSSSVPDLFSDLVDEHLRSSRNPSHQKRKPNTKWKLKSKAFSTLFSFLKKKEEKHEALSVVDRLYAVAFDMRQARRFDDANHLECCIRSMLSSFSKDELTIYGTLLLNLHDPKIDTQNALKIPLVHYEERTLAVLPPKDYHCFGDTQIYAKRYGWFEFFPSSVFTLDNVPLKSTEREFLPASDCSGIFNLTPGSALTAPGFYSATDESLYKRQMKGSLFGGLIQSQVESLDEQLSVPELTSGSFCFSSLKQSDDEGYAASVHSSGAASSSSDVGYISEEDPFELALHYKPSQHYTWETVGRFPQILERPFITESLPDVFDNFYQQHRLDLLLIEPERDIPTPKLTTVNAFILDVVHLLIAAPSDSFRFDSTQRRFVLNPGFHMTGLSPESVLAYSEQFLTCGNFYLQLMSFSEAPALDSFHTDGLVKQAFQEGLRQYLQYYRACILSLKPNLTLLGLSVQLKGILAQMRFLGHLCKCDTEDSFPTGVHLLSYLYNVALDSVFSAQHAVMLSLFRQSCQPYLRFLEDWVFYGTFQDQYKEFMIEINPIYLNFRDKMFWTNAFVMSVDEHGASITPSFLTDLANSIYVCGKSINLLKLCQQQHYLLTKSCSIPRLAICFTQDELVAMETQCAVYVSKVKAMGHQQMQLREERKAAAASARRALIRRVRETAAGETARVEAETEEKKKQKALKKKLLLDELKQQIEDNSHRKLSAKEQERAAERVRLDEADRHELLEAKVDHELERQAKEELIAYYEKLTEEAALKERRALWRVQRSRLREQREELLRRDEEMWEQELLDKEIVLEKAENSLPNWARKGLNEIDVYGSALKLSQRGDNNVEDIEMEAEIEVQRLIHQRHTPQKKLLKLEGVTPLKKTHVKFVEKRVCEESVPEEKAFSVKICDPAMITAGGEETVERKQIKMIPERNTIMESVEEEQKMTVKMVNERNVLEETEEKEWKRMSKGVGDQNVGLETVEMEKRSLVRSVDGEHNTRESSETVEKIYKQNVYGHASEMTQAAEYDLPKTKKVDGRHASVETSDADHFAFQIKPHRLKHSEQSVNQESDEKVAKRSVRFHSDRHVSKESDSVDPDEVRLEKFRQRNIEGHSSRSTVERLLYGSEFGQFASSEEKDMVPMTATEINFWTNIEPDAYSTDFNFNILPEVNLLRGPFNAYIETQSKTKEPHSYISLENALSKALTRPLTAQVELVNSCLLTYFLDQLNIATHFEALRCYLFMQDGEFAHLLSLELFNKLQMKPSPAEIFNPLFLTNSLNKAIAYSLKSNSDKVDNWSFSLKFLPKVIQHNASDALDCLILSYKVDWPLNIVITEACLSKYNQVFSFLLHLKRAVWTLENVCHSLKRAALIRRKLNDSAQLRTLHLYRHKMQHFAKVLQGYIANQVIHVTWKEFQEKLDTILSLDELHTEHVVYLNKAVARCLLNKRAQPVMKIIQDIFNLILKFHSQLTSASWEEEEESGDVAHPAFHLLCNTFKSFNEYSNFLFKVLSKLAARGYQPHLKDLLLQLDFNGYHAASGS